MGSLGFTWVDLVGCGRLGIKWFILEARESHTLTHRQTDTGFLRCTEILLDLITEKKKIYAEKGIKKYNTKIVYCLKGPKLRLRANIITFSVVSSNGF